MNFCGVDDRDGLGGCSDRTRPTLYRKARFGIKKASDIYKNGLTHS